mgnify:CR=1 FL=1
MVDVSVQGVPWVRGWWEVPLTDTLKRLAVKEKVFCGLIGCITEETLWVDGWFNPVEVSIYWCMASS